MKGKIKLLSSITLIFMCCFTMLTGCGNSQARKQVVNFYGWGGGEKTNAWIDNELSPYVKEKYNITLNRVPMNIDEIIMKLTNEKGSTKDGSIDVIWINGENFYYAKENNLLYGPFLEELDNAKTYLNLEGDAANMDFGYPTEGYEAPWGTAQFVFNYDSSKISNPPRSTKALKEYVMNNPGRFTYPQSSDFTGSAFIRTVLYDIVGYDKLKDLPADYETVKSAITPALEFFKEIELYLWKEGQVYPSDSTQLNSLYQDEEVDITMAYTSNNAISMILDGSWTENTKTFVWENGTPFNTHYLAIAANSPNVEGALKVIDAALSPEMQITKADLNGWADLPAIEYEKLSSEEKNKLDIILTPEKQYKDSILSYEELSKYRKPELKSNLVVLIDKIWEDVILFDK